MKITLRNPLLWLTVLILLTVHAFAQGAAPTDTPAPSTGFDFATLVALIGAVVIIARVIVKLTPTPKDDSFMEKVVEWLKHLGLVIKLVAFILLPSTFILLIAGCGTIKPHGNVDVVYNADGTVTAGTGLDIGTNATVNATGGYNVSTGQWSAGISITFKSEADAAAAAAELALHNLGPAPVVRNSATACRIDTFDPRSRYHAHIIEAAIKHGAEFKGI